MKNTLQLLLLLCSFNCFSLAAHNQPSVYDFDIKHWNSTDGLSSNSVRSVSQDSQGFIWLATLYGLNRFDGVQFEHFTKESHRHLASNSTTRLLHDSQGYMWVGTKAGLSGFDPLTLQFERYQILSEVTAIIEVRPGEIWVAADHLFRIHNGKVSRVEQILSQVSQLELVDEHIWIMGSEQLYQMDLDGNVKSYPLPAGLMQTPVYDLYWAEASLFIAGESGFYHLDTVSDEVKKCPLPDQNSTAVYKLLRDSRDNSWISAHRKLFHRHAEQPWQYITGDELGSYPWFSDIFEDRDNNIWLASFSDGIYRAAPGNIRRLVPFQPDAVVRSVAVTPSDTLLIAGQSDIGELTADGQYHSLLTAEQLDSGTVHDIYWPDATHMWLATDNGVMAYQRDTQQLTAQFASLEGFTVRVLQADIKGGLWIGGVMGLWHYQHDTLAPFALNNELESHHITVLQQQAEQLVFGTTRGLYQYEQQRLSRLGVGTALYNSYITALQLLPGGQLLASTLDDGIFIRRTDHSWYQLHTANGLPHSPVVSITYDAETDYIWISSHKGIFRLLAADLERPNLDNLSIQEVLGPYDRQLGTVPGRCCNGAGHAKVAFWQQQYWYPTLKGLVAVPAELNRKTDKPVQPVIKLVQGQKNYQLSAEQQRLVMELDDRNISIKYSALEFIKPAALQFRYQLKGFENSWHYATDRREAVYTNLAPGRFVFRLQVRLENDPWTTLQTQELELIVPKRFDETLVYRGLWLVLFLFCLYGLIWLLRRNTVHQQQQLERLVKQRTQELENSNLKLNELNEQLTLLTHKDSLTGLRNRRFMFEQLPKDIEHFQRNRESMQTQNKCVALIHLDLDNFKQVNDQFGNSAGDSCIQQVAGVLIRETRGSDYVVRFAGEEFVLVLRDIPLELVAQFSHRLNELVAKTVFNLPDGHRTRLTCSVGYAVYPLDLLGGQLINWEVSLQLAEMALYHVKHAGKNGVATIVFDQQVDAFEFEDSTHVEAQIERLLAAGLAHFELNNR